MTTAVASAPASSKPVFMSVLRSELIKLRSLRSSYWCLIVVALLILAFSLIGAPLFAGQWHKMSDLDQTQFLAESGTTGFVLQGGGLAQLAAGVLGILFITGEYSSGMIRTTFAATPQRNFVMLAKAVVVAIPVAIVSFIFALAAFNVGESFFAGKSWHGISIQQHLGDPATWRMIIGGALYLGVTAIMGIAIGTLLRHTGGSITAFVGLVFVLPGLMQLVPHGVRDNIEKFLPSTSGQSLFQAPKFSGLPDVIKGVHNSSQLSPWIGFAVYCAWAALFYFAAMTRIRTRDA